MVILHVTLTAVVFGIAIGIVIGILMLYYLSPKPRQPTENEKYYRDAQSSNRKRLPSLFDTATVQLSCIVPAFDESERLPTMLNEAVEYLEAKKSQDPLYTYEIIIVDDGSRDGTSETALDCARKQKAADIRVITFDKNRGKGGAVTQGMLAARGKRCLMVDADGATRFSDLAKLETALGTVVHEDHGIAVGSRAHLVSTNTVVKRSFIRNLLMHGFHMLVYILGIRAIDDTQCGFKLFTRKSAQYIFPNMHVERWIFDVECLMIAQHLNIPLIEVYVNWHEIDGSKVNLMIDSIQMARDLLMIRLNYILGIWSIDVNKAVKSQ